jgi:hypothetical protein
MVQQIREQTLNYIYFIQDGDAVKIGISLDPAARLKDLQLGNPRPLSILFQIEGDLDGEAMLHKLLAAERIRSEWFSLGGILRTFTTNLFEARKAQLFARDSIHLATSPSPLRSDVHILLEGVPICHSVPLLAPIVPKHSNDDELCATLRNLCSACLADGPLAQFFANRDFPSCVYAGKHILRDETEDHSLCGELIDAEITSGPYPWDVPRDVCRLCRRRKINGLLVSLLRGLVPTGEA